MNKIYSVGIIGAGISGVVTALQLADNGIESVLFEQKNSIINGPPFCHLHAGGNLYPDISDNECRLLLKQSIEMARLFPHSIDKRPTFISVPKSEIYNTSDIENRLNMITEYYYELIENDQYNEVLNSAGNYYKAYTESELKQLLQLPTVNNPESLDEWMINAVKLIDIEKLKTPVFMVQEYGWNMFRTAAQAQLALNNTNICELKTNTPVTKINDVRNKKLGYNWEIYTENEIYKVHYLVNSSGYMTGKIEEPLMINNERLIEFKAAYVSRWEPQPGLLPEFIFHGERGTPHGMAQLTPYAEHYYQIHGMTNEITLFKNGLVCSHGNNIQPTFDNEINQKIWGNWDKSETQSRTQKAIEYVSRFVPSFHSATPGAQPLYGVQQVRGKSLSRRVGEVSFPTKMYARCEIIKASSALTVANNIICKLAEEGIYNGSVPILKQNELLNNILKSEVDILASEIAAKRGYPKAMARLVVEKKKEGNGRRSSN